VHQYLLRTEVSILIDWQVQLLSLLSMTKCNFSWRLHSDILYIYLLSTTYSIKFSIYLYSKFLSFCFTNPEYRLLLMTFSHQLIRISEGVHNCSAWTRFKILTAVIRPSLWPSGQSSWLQIQRSGFDSQRNQIFWEVVGLERGPLSLVSTIEELHERKSGGSGLEIREYGRRDPSRWRRGTIYPQKLALISPTSGGRSVGLVRSWTKATEFLLFSFCKNPLNIWLHLSSVRWRVVILVYEDCRSQRGA
jgi:hypothetical protein